MNKDVAVDGIDEEDNTVCGVDEVEPLANPDKPPPDQSTQAWSKTADPVSEHQKELEVM